jgi:hypothetical protein
MVRGGHGLHKVYPGLPCPTLLCPAGVWPAGVFHPFGHPTLYAYGSEPILSQKEEALSPDLRMRITIIIPSGIFSQPFSPQIPRIVIYFQIAFEAWAYGEGWPWTP